MMEFIDYISILIGSIIIIWLIISSSKNKMVKVYTHIPEEYDDLSLEELELYNLINNHRNNLKLPKLKIEKLACEICKNEVVKHVKENTDVTHVGEPQRAERTGAKYVGEICAQGIYYPKILLAHYLLSTDHRKNIENPIFEWIGISYINGINYCIFTKY